MRVWVYEAYGEMYVSPIKPGIDVFAETFSDAAIEICDTYGRKLFKFKLTKKPVEVELTAKRVKKGGAKK